MPLQHSLIPVQFSGGLDQKRAEKGVMPGSFLRLENCVRRKFSLVEKRFGLTALSTEVFGDNDDIAAGRHLAAFQSDVTLMDGSKFYSYSQENDKWISKGAAPTAQVTGASFIRNSDTQALADCASADGISVLAWEDSRGGVRYSVYDDTTGAALVYDTEIDASGLRPKVVALRDSFLIGYMVGVTLLVRTISRTDPTTLPAAQTIRGAAVDSTAYWDMDVYDETYAVYAVSLTTPALEVGYVDQHGVVGSVIGNALPAPVPFGTVAAEDFCSVVGDALNGKIWVLYGVSTTARVMGVTPDFVSADDHTMAAETARNATGVVRASDDALVVFYEIAAASVKNHYIKSAVYTYAPGATVVEDTAPATLIKSVGLASKAFEVDGAQYFTAVHESSLQPTYFTVRQDGVLVTRILGGISGGLTRDSAHALASGLPRFTIAEDGRHVTALQIRNRLTIETGGVTLTANKGLNKVALSFAASTVVTRTLGLNMHIAGGSLLDYDGVSVFEHGFHVFPEDLTKAAAGGGSLAAGDYSFRVLYEWVDSKGQIHRSAPSITVTQTAALNDKITLTVPTLRLTNRTASTVKIVVYMAAVGLSSVYYRKSETANTTATDTVAIEVTSAVTTTNEILYTTGGVYENIAPPACTCTHVYKNRLWIGGLEIDEVWYSKEYISGEAVAFSDFFRMPMEAEGGSVTAFATLDSTLAIFKNTRIYLLNGEGPLDTGAQNDYGRPSLIAGDVGTSIPNSVVETPVGLIFKSDKGFYNLTRNYQSKYIGADVEDFNSYTVTGSVLLADDNEVRFFTEEGTCLVYNYFFNQWSTFDNHEAIAACNGLDTVLHLNSDGVVQQEVRDSYEDNGARYSMAIETSWFAFSGLQGFQRIYELALIGDQVSDHITRLKVAYDYETAYNETVYFDTRTGLVSDTYGDDDLYGDSEVYGGTGSSVYQFRFKPARQKCEAIKLRIEDLDTVGANGGGSVKLMALTFDIGRKSGIYRLPAHKSIGAA